LASYGRHGNFDYASSRFISHIGNSIVSMPSLPDLPFTAHRLAAGSATSNSPRISLTGISLPLPSCS
jgi:hypothetical protein